MKIAKMNIHYLHALVLISLALLVLQTKLFIDGSYEEIQRRVIRTYNQFLCDPIIDSQEQFYVEIDGETYPKLIPSYFNRSINFDCLNRTNKVVFLVNINSMRRNF